MIKEGLAQPKWAVLLAFLLTFFCGWLNRTTAQVSLVTDDKEYHSLAVSLARGRGFSLKDETPSVARPPLYPLFISLIYRWNGINILNVLKAQVCLAGVTAGLIFGMTFRVTGRGWAASCAGLLCFLNPILFSYTRYLYSETLFTMLLTAGAFTWNEGVRHIGRRAWWNLATGILLGLACLTRSIVLYFIPFWIVIDWFRHRTLNRSLCVVLAAFIFTVAPWTIRNYRLFGYWIPVSAGSGYALWAGSQPGPYPSPEDYVSSLRPLDWRSAAGDRSGNNLALSLFRRHWLFVLLDLPKRSLHFWLTSHSTMLGYPERPRAYWKALDFNGLASKAGGFALQMMLLVCAFRGWYYNRKCKVTDFPVMITLYTWLIVILTDWGPNRYHVPLFPVLIFLGVIGFARPLDSPACNFYTS